MVTTETNVDDLRQRQRYDRPSNLQKVDQKIQGEETNSSTGRLQSKKVKGKLPKEVVMPRRYQAVGSASPPLTLRNQVSKSNLQEVVLLQ